MPAGVAWCTLCHTPAAAAVPAAVPAATSALVGGQVGEHRIAELVAQLAVGESRRRGPLWLGAGRSRAGQALVAGVGVGSVLITVLGVLWVIGSLL